MTKKEMFAEIINLAEGKPTTVTPVEIIEFASHEIELLEKKASTPRKPTAAQVENEKFKELILGYLATLPSESSRTIKEFQSEIPEIAELSNQRMSHILAALVEKGALVKSYVKKTPFFALATE